MNFSRSYIHQVPSNGTENLPLRLLVQGLECQGKNVLTSQDYRVDLQDIWVGMCMCVWCVHSVHAYVCAHAHTHTHTRTHTVGKGGKRVPFCIGLLPNFNLAHLLISFIP